MKNEDFFNWAFNEIIVKNARTKLGETLFYLLRVKKEKFKDFMKDAVPFFLDFYNKKIDSEFTISGDNDSFVEELTKYFKKIANELECPISREEFFSARRGSSIIDADGKTLLIFMDASADPRINDSRSVRYPEWGRNASTSIFFYEGNSIITDSAYDIIIELNYPGIKIIPLF